jgi:hypothetical protein
MAAAYPLHPTFFGRGQQNPGRMVGVVLDQRDPVCCHRVALPELPSVADAPPLIEVGTSAEDTLAVLLKNLILVDPRVGTITFHLDEVVGNRCRSSFKFLISPY